MKLFNALLLQKFYKLLKFKFIHACVLNTKGKSLKIKIFFNSAAFLVNMPFQVKGTTKNSPLLFLNYQLLYRKFR